MAQKKRKKTLKKTVKKAIKKNKKMIQENVPKTHIILILSVLEQENERHWSTSEIQKLIEKHPDLLHRNRQHGIGEIIFT